MTRFHTKQKKKEKTMDQATIQKLETQLQERYPAGIPRCQIGIASGGVLHPRTMANRDSRGDGISGRFAIGRRVIYPVKNVVQFLQQKSTPASAA